jgi:hypothetical protein
MEMDQTQLKEMGIKKVGDRVRIGSQAKQLRNKEYKKVSRRVSNRVRRPPSHIRATADSDAAITGHARPSSIHSFLIRITTAAGVCSLDPHELTQ